MRNLLLMIALNLSATAGLADIAWNADRLAPGAQFTMRDATGTVTHVKLGHHGDGHAFEVFVGMGVDAAYLGRYHTNARGEVIALHAADGAVTRFEPHRCSRTLGRCRFTVLHSDGFAEPRVRVTEAARGGLRYAEYGLDGFIAEGALRLDANGTAKGGWKRVKGETRKTRSRRVMIAEQ